MRKRKIEQWNIVSIKYYANTDLVQTWGPLVYLLENRGYIAIPRYSEKMMEPGIFEKEVKTNAPVEVVIFIASHLEVIRSVFPGIISITIRE